MNALAGKKVELSELWSYSTCCIVVVYVLMLFLGPGAVPQCC